MRAPVLKASHTYQSHGATYRITARGGLSMIRGNSAPHFSVTADIDRKSGAQWVDYAGGSLHDDILRHWPDLADMVALHLSDIDGQPMHAEANGWYWLEGALGGLGDQYHGASGDHGKAPEECLRIFADHCRLTLDAARALAVDVLSGIAAEPSFARHEVVRARWAEACKGMGERWNAEARACIAKHNLTVYGDPWPVQSGVA